MRFYPNLSASNRSVEDLQCAFVKMFPFWDVKETSNGFYMGGPMLDVLHSITEGVSMKAYLGTPKDGQWGQQVGTDSIKFNGAMGMVQRGVVDVFLGPSGIIAERLLVAHPFPYYFGYTTMLVPAPKKYIDPFSYVKAFAPIVWFLIFLSWIFVACSASFLNKQATIKIKYRSDSEYYTIGQYFWDYFQYLLQSYGNRKVEAVRERILLSSWLLSGVVIMALLSGELTTNLLLKESEDYVNCVDDLLRFPKLNIVAEKGSAPERFFNLFQSPHHPVFKALQPRLQSVRGVMTNRSVAYDVLEKINRREAVLAAPLSYLKGLLNDRYAFQRSQCRFHIIEHHLALTSVGMLFNLNFSRTLRKQIEKRVSFHIDHGLLTNAMENRMKNYTKCLFSEQTVDNSVEALMLSEIGGVFVLLSIGILVSIVCFVMEKLFCVS